MKDYLIKKKSHLVYASRLDDEWFTNHKDALLDKVRFLYVGRMSPEKGIFEFLNMFNKIKFDILNEMKKLFLISDVFNDVFKIISPK